MVTEMKFDERVKNQADVDKLYGNGKYLSGGVYKGEKFFDGDLFYHNDGSVRNLMKKYY